MGKAYGAICNACETRFQVSEGSGMTAMPFHCDQCGREWWWEFGPGDPMGKEPNSPQCKCGGRFTADSPARCPNCRSKNFGRDPDEPEVLYD